MIKKFEAYKENVYPETSEDIINFLKLNKKKDKIEIDNIYNACGEDIEMTVNVLNTLTKNKIYRIINKFGRKIVESKNNDTIRYWIHEGSNPPNLRMICEKKWGDDGYPILLNDTIFWQEKIIRRCDMVDPYGEEDWEENWEE